MDLLLLFIAMLCQAIMGWMGFVVSTRTPMRPLLMEAIFVACAVVGTGALIWMGGRSNRVQDDMQSTLHRISVQLDSRYSGPMVKVAVPVACAPRIKRPPDLMSYDQMRDAIAHTSNTTEKVRMVTDQLLLWQGYGPELEAVAKACASQPSVKGATPAPQ